MWFSKVVLPAPRKPDSTVTGKLPGEGEVEVAWLILGISIMARAGSLDGDSAVRGLFTCAAGRALAVKLDGGLAQGECVLAHPVPQAAADFRVDEFVDLPAFVADREGEQAGPAGGRLPAGQVGVQRFEPVHQAMRGEPLQRPVDLGRRAETLLAQPPPAARRR